MKAAFLLTGLLCGAAAMAQTSVAQPAAAPAAAPPNPPAVTDAKPATTAEELDKKALPSDLETHPYRMFGSKPCYLTPLLRWEKLDPEQRGRTPNPMRVWQPFRGTVLQLIRSGKLTQRSSPTPTLSVLSQQEDVSGLLLQQNNEVVFVKNLPAQRSLTNGQTLAFHAIKVPGVSYTYTNADGAERTAEAYDYGIPFQPKFAPVITRTNLAALYRAQLIKSLNDQIAVLENNDTQLREQELNLKRLRSNYRQTRRAAAYEQAGINQIGAQRAAISQQIAALQKQKAQLEGTASNSGTNTDANATTNTTATPGSPNPNAPGRTSPLPNRYRTPPQPSGSP